MPGEFSLSPMRLIHVQSVLCLALDVHIAAKFFLSINCFILAPQIALLSRRFRRFHHSAKGGEEVKRWAF
jgi:hypothetical protein